MSEILRVENLSKNYLIKRALSNVSFSLNSGRILGLMGPNGSGKTTLLKILAGLLQPSSGNAYVCDKEIGIETKRIVSFLPDRNVMYPAMKVKDAIGFYADFFADFDRVKAHDMLKDMKLDENETVRSNASPMRFRGLIRRLPLRGMPPRIFCG